MLALPELPLPVSAFPVLPFPMSPVPVFPRPIFPLSPGPPSWALLPLENVVSPDVVDGVAWFEANCGLVLTFVLPVLVLLYLFLC